MEWILFFTYLIAFYILICRWGFFSNAGSLKITLIAFSVKIVCGFAVALLYSNYYDGGDTFVYMQDARIFLSSLKEGPSLFAQLITGVNQSTPELQHYYSQLKGDSGTGYGRIFNNYLIYVRMMAVLGLLSNGYYHVQMLIVIFISMTGLTALFRLINRYDNPAVIFSVYFVPSVLFWGSALLKEPVILFLICMIFYHIENAASLKSLILFLLFFILLAMLKFFIAIAILPGLIACLIYHKTKKGMIRWTVLCYFILFLLSIVGAQVDERVNVYSLLHHQQIIFMKNAVYYGAGSLMELIPFAPEPVSVMKRLPEAIFTALLKPFPWECKGLVQLAASIENIFLFLLSLFLTFKLKTSYLRQSPFAATAITAGLLILAITAFTTPVAGALVRLKIPGLFLLLTGLASCNDITFRKTEKKLRESNRP